MHLLERSDVFRRLHALADEAAGGRGRVVCLLGEAGIGKSSVARHLADEVKLRVFWGACEDLSTPAPLSPLFDFARVGGWRLPLQDDFADRLATFSVALGELTAKPTLAVVEDLHWADDATGDFVRYVARRIGGTPLLLLTTARNDSTEAQNRLRRALADVSAEDFVRVDLPRLSEAAVRQAAIACRRDGGAVFALTSGNPFLTMEVLRGAETIPPTVRDALLWRAEKLALGGRDVLNAASIFPRRVERTVLAEMISYESDNAVEECLAAGLLVEEGGFYSFRHEIARCAIEEALSEAARTRLNRHALEILKRLAPKATARLVHHAVEARDIEAICELAPRAAAEASEAGAHREAYRHYAAALAHADRFEERKRAELFERAGYELQLIGRVGDAITAFQSALHLRRQLGDAMQSGDDLRWLGRLHYNAGDRVRADRLGREAIETLEPLGPSYELAMAYANLALLTALRDERAAAASLAERTLQLAEQLGRDEIAADAHGTLGIVKQWQDYDASFAHFQSGLDLALKLNRPEIVARMYNNGGNVQLNARASARAREWLEAGIRYCTDHDLLTWTTYMQGLLAQLLVREGAWDAARELAERTLKAELSPVFRFPASAALARLNIRTGQEVDVLFQNLAFDDEPQRRLVYAPLLGERAWLSQANIDLAVRVLEEAAPVAARVGDVWAAGEIAFWRYKLAELAPAQADTLAAPYRDLLTGDWKAAAEAWRKQRAPYETALALLSGDHDACDEALEILDELGAGETASRARSELRARGVRGVRRGPRRATQENKAGLTRREMDVLLLMQQGRSNADIARQLSTAVKTIDHHVSSILAKLKASSRGEAVARARQIGVVD
jgi:DNA-binding CsgD family transcriptional regulator